MTFSGVLSDRDIHREVAEYSRSGHGLNIEPFDDDNVQPASYDLTLGNEWEVPVEANVGELPITLGDGLPDTATRRVESDSFVLSSMQRPYFAPDGTRPFVLGHVEETIDIPAYMTAEVKGRSSVGRLGVIPHTAGWGDPGFEGQLTLEFVNLGPNPIELDAGRRIAQVVFQYTNTESANPYGEKDDSKYQGQTGVTESRIEQDHD